MSLAILHNVIIGHFCVGIVACKRGKMYYNATLYNLASADLHTMANQNLREDVSMMHLAPYPQEHEIGLPRQKMQK